MFQRLKKKLFQNGTSSPNTKRAELDGEEIESSNTSTTRLSNKIDGEANSSDTLAQNSIHPEPKPLPINNKANSLQIVENVDISGSNQVDKIQQTHQVQKSNNLLDNGIDRNQAEMPEEIRNNPNFVRYWNNRNKLFSKYDEGIQLKGECWYTVTPEEIAADMARRCSKYDVILDAFCGAGGNSIQFALHCKKVITTDIDPEKLKLAKHNAQIYGVADKIEFILGDFFQIAASLTADVVFLSPPWGGPSYIDYQEYQLSQIMEQLHLWTQTITSKLSRVILMMQYLPLPHILEIWLKISIESAD